MGVEVDKARCDSVPFGVEFPCTITFNIADCDNGVAVNCDITRIGLRTRAIDNKSATDDEIMRHDGVPSSSFVSFKSRVHQIIRELSLFLYCCC